jgi:hypothetical protein
MPKPENMTPAQLANLEKGRFQPGQSGNPAGRKKNRVTALLKQVLPKGSIKKSEALSIDEINTIEKSVLSLQLADLQLLAKMEETPAYMKTLAMAIIIDMKNGQTKTVDLLRSRQYGTPTQKMDLTSGGQPIHQREMSPEQAKKVIAELDEEY